MHNISWDDLRYCLAVVQEGSVTAAARKLDVNHTTVSRRISALERNLNAPLFDRSTAGWLLTPVGETILKFAEQMAEEVHSIQRMAKADRQDLSGKLRVTAVDVCIQRLLLPGIKAFSKLYPDIDIELIASESSLDLSIHEADIAFRTTNEPPQNVVGKKIAEFANAIYGTPQLYRQYQEQPGSVGAISWQGDGHSLPGWLSQAFSGMPVRYRANSLNVVYDLTRNGMGFSMLPCALGDMEPALQRLPCQVTSPRAGFWVLSHIDLRTTARIRIFRDFMIDSILPYVPLIEGEREFAYRNAKPSAPWALELATAAN